MDVVNQQLKQIADALESGNTKALECLRSALPTLIDTLDVQRTRSLSAADYAAETRVIVERINAALVHRQNTD
jgi:hypothetical protein